MIATADSAKPLYPPPTLIPMAKLGLDPKEARHLADVLRPIVDERFDGNATKAAKAIGIAQSHMSQILAARGRGAGIHVLKRIRAFTGLTIDDLLGLPPLRPTAPSPGLPTGREIIEMLRQTADRIEHETLPPKGHVRALPPAQPHRRRPS